MKPTKLLSGILNKAHHDKNLPVAATCSYLSENLTENINRIKNEMGSSSDLSVRHLESVNNNQKYAILFISGLVDTSNLNSLSLELTELCKVENTQNKENHDIFFYSFKNLLLGSKTASEGSDYEELYNHLLVGNTIVLVDGCNRFIAINTYGPEGRTIEEPTSQTIIRGPKEGFTERISINVSQIRRRIKSKYLRIESLNMGIFTKTAVMIIYIEHIAKEDIVKEVKKRLNRIDIDGILESGYIEELTKDDPYSLFPTFIASEKPDSVTAGLLEGRIAIFVDGTPFVLIVPALFTDFFQVSEDYYHNFLVSSFIRVIRYMAFFLALLVPAAFILFTTFHQDMISVPLLVSIAAQREGTPLPAFAEALIMTITFEILQEAGVRMPRAIGPAVSIVGALVLGQAAVEAGFISAAMVIVVSITAIASFVMPYYSLENAVRVARLGFMLLAATFGLYGVFMGLMLMIIHLGKLKSIGVPYLTAFTPRMNGKNINNFLRVPLWNMRFRPVFSGKTDEAKNEMRGSVKSEMKDDQEVG